MVITCVDVNYLILYIQHVPMVTSDLSVATLSWKVEWRSVTMQCGEQCVMIYGVLLMPMLPADS